MNRSSATFYGYFSSFRKARFMKRFIYLICLLSLFSCRKEQEQSASSLLDTIETTKYYNAEIFTDSNLKLYGQWRFLYIYDDAGIIAGPGKIDPNYDYLVIKKYGIYGKIKANKVIESGKIEVVKQNATMFEINLKLSIKNNSTYPSDIWYVKYMGKDSLEMVDASIGCGYLSNVFKKIKHGINGD